MGSSEECGEIGTVVEYLIREVRQAKVSEKESGRREWEIVGIGCITRDRECGEWKWRAPGAKK